MEIEIRKQSFWQGVSTGHFLQAGKAPLAGEEKCAHLGSLRHTALYNSYPLSGSGTNLLQKRHRHIDLRHSLALRPTEQWKALQRQPSST